jgi:hypothetical protein
MFVEVALPVVEEDGVLSLVELWQVHPLKDGVVDLEVPLPVGRLWDRIWVLSSFGRFFRTVISATEVFLNVSQIIRDVRKKQ